MFVSRRNAAEAKQLGIGKGVRSELIRAGVNFSPILPLKFDPAAKKASLKIPANAKVVLALANFKPLKNPIHFVLAAYKVLSQMKNVYFIFTGEGPLKETACNLAKNLGIENRCCSPAGEATRWSSWPSATCTPASRLGKGCRCPFWKP